MVKVDAPRFDITECRNDLDREFIEALHARSESDGWHADVWPRDDRFLLTIDIVADNCVIRMLRVDFFGDTVAFGDDETYQLVTDLAPARPGVVVLTGRPISDLATAAADWLAKRTVT
jgi:hypothetical protein